MKRLSWLKIVSEDTERRKLVPATDKLERNRDKKCDLRSAAVKVFALAQRGISVDLSVKNEVAYIPSYVQH